MLHDKIHNADGREQTPLGCYLKTNDTIEVVGWVIFLGGDSSQQQSALYALVPLLGLLLLLILLQTKPTMEKDWWDGWEKKLKKLSFHHSFAASLLQWKAKQSESTPWILFRLGIKCEQMWSRGDAWRCFAFCRFCDVVRTREELEQKVAVRATPRVLSMWHYKWKIGWRKIKTCRFGSTKRVHPSACFFFPIFFLMLLQKWRAPTRGFSQIWLQDK